MSSILALIPWKPEQKQRRKCKHFIAVCDPGGKEQNREEGRAKRDAFSM